MRSILIIAVVILATIITANAQTIIELTNPSFEDSVGAQRTPTGWFDCLFADETGGDIQPGVWGITQVSAEGYTYLGLATSHNGTYEAVGQQLPIALDSGATYTFSVFAAMLSPEYSDIPGFKYPCKIRIWGGTSPCDALQLLDQSSAIQEMIWRKRDFKFTAAYKDMNYIILEAYYAVPEYPTDGYLLIDNCSALEKVK